MIDRISGKDYLLNSSLSVVNVSKNIEISYKRINITFRCLYTCCEEEYDDKRFKEDVCIAESYSLIDKNIGLHENSFDKRTDYLNRNEYMKSVRNCNFKKYICY